MEDDAPQFPLFNLPDAPLKCVLQNLDMIHQIEFSIHLRKVKKLVKSLNLEVEQISVTIGVQVMMKIQRPQFQQIDLIFYIDQLNYGNRPPSAEMYLPDLLQTYAQVNRTNEVYEWNKIGFEIKDWIHHVLSIFNRSKVDSLCFSGGENLFVLKYLQKTINDVIQIDIVDGYSPQYIQQIVQVFPCAKQVKIPIDTLNNLEECHNIFCQRFDILSLATVDRNSLTRCKLDDLLIINSQSIQINSDMNLKHFNSFLKHWIKGSNPRMKHVAVRFSDEDDDKEILGKDEIILDGLNSQLIPNENERTFKRIVNGSVGTREVIVKGGFDIQREDGTTATLMFYKEEEDDDTFVLEVFVWH